MFRARPFLEPVDDAVRDALRLAREKRDEATARLRLYPPPDVEARATTQSAPALERAEVQRG